MKLWSDDFKHGESIPVRFTCDGQDLSPHLAWSDLPQGTQSLALMCHDPDAPVGDWIHWLVHDIPAETDHLPRGGPLPSGAKETVNDFGYSRYGGPCPPSGRHRYFFIRPDQAEFQGQGQRPGPGFGRADGHLRPLTRNAPGGRQPQNRFPLDLKPGMPYFRPSSYIIALMYLHG